MRARPTVFVRLRILPSRGIPRPRTACRRTADRSGRRGSRRAGEGDSHYNFRMSILKVARMGHPVLRAKARTLDKRDIRDGTIQKLIDDMIETMTEYHGVGLAAPQV